MKLASRKERIISSKGFLIGRILQQHWDADSPRLPVLLDCKEAPMAKKHSLTEPHRFQFHWDCSSLSKEGQVVQYTALWSHHFPNSAFAGWFLLFCL